MTCVDGLERPFGGYLLQVFFSIDFLRIPDVGVNLKGAASPLILITALIFLSLCRGKYSLGAQMSFPSFFPPPVALDTPPLFISLYLFKCSLPVNILQTCSGASEVFIYLHVNRVTGFFFCFAPIRLPANLRFFAQYKKCLPSWHWSASSHLLFCPPSNTQTLIKTFWSGIRH